MQPNNPSQCPVGRGSAAIPSSSLVPGMPAPVANCFRPLDQQLKDEQRASVARAVHAINPNVRYHTTASSEAMSLAANRAYNLSDHFAAVFWASIAPVNNVAIMEIQEAFAQLSHSSYFKRNVKHAAKLTISRINNYEQALLDNMAHNLNGDRRQYWLDYSDEHYERLRHDIDIFRFTILQQLTKYGEKHRHLKSHLVVSNALINYAVGMFDKYFSKIREVFSVDVERPFRLARLSYVADPWLTVVDNICLSRAPIDFNTDPQVKLAFQVIESKIINLKSLESIGDAAIGLNPEIAEEEEFRHNALNDRDHVSKTFFKIFKS